MLYKKGEIKRGVSEIVDTEMLVPKDHLLRKVDSAVDFEKIYEFVEDLYCKDNDRPSIDPVVLIKMVIIQHLFGITSLRKTAAEVQVNVAYRWFLGYSLLDETPHFSTISHNTNKYPIFTHFFIAIWKNYNLFKQNPIQAFARMGFIYSLKRCVITTQRFSSF